MNDKEYLSKLLQQQAYATYATSSSFLDYMEQFPLTSEESKQKVVSYKAWDTLRRWVAELIIVDGNHINITYSKRDKSEIRITIEHIDSQQSDVYHLSKDDIGVAVLPKRISKLLRDVWNQKELERSKHSVEYYTSKYISKHKY